MSQKSVAAVIPARFASSRFPGKVLVDLLGKPLLQHVYEMVRKSQLIEEVYVAVDDERVYDAVLKFGGLPIMTDPELPSGTDRVASILPRISADFVINVQADEPLIASKHLDQMGRLLREESCPVVTLAEKRHDFPVSTDVNVVKVVVNSTSDAIYFSRAPIPYLRYQSDDVFWLKHVGVYGYERAFLIEFTRMEKTLLERSEGLEQLRILENGGNIKVLMIGEETIGVDVPEDLERLRRHLCQSKSL